MSRFAPLGAARIGYSLQIQFLSWVVSSGRLWSWTMCSASGTWRMGPRQPSPPMGVQANCGDVTEAVESSPVIHCTSWTDSDVFKDFFNCIFVFLELLFCISGTLLTKGFNWPPWRSKNVTLQTEASNWLALIQNFQKCYITDRGIQLTSLMI